MASILAGRNRRGKCLEEKRWRRRRGSKYRIDDVSTTAKAILISSVCGMALLWAMSAPESLDWTEPRGEAQPYTYSTRSLSCFQDAVALERCLTI